MLKRLFWLTLFGVAMWVTWRWFEQRQSQQVQYSPATPPFEPTAPAVPPALLSTEETPVIPKRVDDTEIQELFDSEEPTKDSSAANPPPASPVEPIPPEEPKTQAATDEPSVTDAKEEEGTETIPVITGYCMRCKAKHVIMNAVEVTTESGRRGVRGICPTCDANMFAFLKETKS
ncbi:MAG: DUF5679 domain-containing protein [Chloroflexota bacterium]